MTDAADVSEREWADQYLSDLSKQTGYRLGTDKKLAELFRDAEDNGRREAVDALRKYGSHKDWCDWWMPPLDRNSVCICGFVAKIARLEESDG